MILDSRIKDGKRPLTCYDIEEAEKYVGKLCYINSNYDFFRNLDLIQKTILKGVEDCEEPFHYDSDRQCEFCLPCEWVEQKSKITYKPYTLDTWGLDFNPGDVVFFRGKEDTPKGNNYYKCMYLGHLENENNRILVILGPWLFSFFELFELYEIYRNGSWEPFGRKVETIDLNVI